MMSKSLLIDQEKLKILIKEFTDSNVYWRDPLSSQHERALILIAQLNERIRDLQHKINVMESKVQKAAIKSKHMDILNEAIDKHPMLKAEWENFLVLLQLTTEK